IRDSSWTGVQTCALPIWLFLPIVLLLPLRAFAIKQKPAREAAGHAEAVLVTAQNARTHKTLHGAGVLIAPRAVLTAAHCAAEFDSWIVMAPAARSQRVRVREARVHPKY